MQKDRKRQYVSRRALLPVRLMIISIPAKDALRFSDMEVQASCYLVRHEKENLCRSYLKALQIIKGWEDILLWELVCIAFQEGSLPMACYIANEVSRTRLLVIA